MRRRLIDDLISANSEEKIMTAQIGEESANGTVVWAVLLLEFTRKKIFLLWDSEVR